MFCRDNVTWGKKYDLEVIATLLNTWKKKVYSWQRIKYTTRKLYYIFTWESCTSKELVFEI